MFMYVFIMIISTRLVFRGPFAFCVGEPTNLISCHSIYSKMYIFQSGIYIFLYHTVAAMTRIRTNIMLMYSSKGAVAFISDQYTLGKHWQRLLDDKVRSDPEWPFQATIEFYDCASDPILCAYYLSSRLTNVSLPPVTAIIGGETDLLGNIAANFGRMYQVPVLLAVTNPDPVEPVVPPLYAYSFLIEPPAQYQFRELINTYVEVGVSTIVTVQKSQKYNTYNKDSCFSAANLAASRGIVIQEFISLPEDYTVDYIRDVIDTIRRNHDPDAIMWCDWASCAITPEFNAIPIFKSLNYLPKALSFLDCIDQPNVASVQDMGLYHYVSAPQFVNEKLRGQEYTEDFTPYASHFRPNTTIKTVTDLMNLGATEDSPSSTKLFFDWYRSETHSTATYQTVMAWAAIDLLESALYRACAITAPMATHIASIDVMDMLRSAQASTPIGRVSFDGSNVNSPQASIFVQLLYSSVTAEIVAPSTLQTAIFVYPMPTWDERIYTWKLMSSATVVPIAMAIIGSFIVMAIGVTHLIHRHVYAIKAVNAWHVAAQCTCACTVFWCLVFLWQADMIQSQCDAYLWLSYLPASFVVVLTNMKAYRLSVFIRASLTRRGNVKPKPVSHAFVLLATLAQVAGTAVILLIAQLSDRGVSMRFVADINRPLYDEYHCVTRRTNPSLLYFLVAIHIGSSLVSIFSIRHATEAFKDGGFIKTALLILYMSVVIVFILQRLGLNEATMYVFRACFFIVSITLFIARLYIVRCIPFWVPKPVRDQASVYYIQYIQPVVDYINPKHDEALAELKEMEGHDTEEDAFENSDAPPSDNLEEMASVLHDPERLPLFMKVAASCFCTENVDFLMACMEYGDDLEAILVDHSHVHNEPMKIHTLALYEKYIRPGCDLEVNVSAGCRRQLEQQLAEWNQSTPLITVKAAHLSLQQDEHRRQHILDTAVKEISIMTYQNLWNKFRAEETLCDMETTQDGKRRNSSKFPISEKLYISA